MDPFSYLISLPYVGWLLHLVLALVGFAIHALCALAVFNDANRSFESQNRSTVLVPGYIWATAALLGGITTTVVYWLLHHSTLRPTAVPPQS